MSANPHNTNHMDMPGGFVVSEAALASDDLSTAPWTLRFNDASVERDYMRFRVSKARVCVFAAMALGGTFSLLNFFRNSGTHPDAAAFAAGGAVLLGAFAFDLLRGLPLSGDKRRPVRRRPAS